MKKESYVYALLDPREPGEYLYNDILIPYKPFYIGKGIGNRLNYHSCNCKRDKLSNAAKYNKIKKIKSLGLKIISIKIVSDISDKDACDLEEKIILHFGKIKDGGILTNICDSNIKTAANQIGGKNIHSKSVYQYSLDGKFIKKWNSSCREVARKIGVAQSSLSYACSNNGATCNNYQWSYEYKGVKISSTKRYDMKKRNKIVEKIFISGKTILIESATEAAKLLNITKSTFCTKHIKDKKPDFEGCFYRYLTEITK